MDIGGEAGFSWAQAVWCPLAWRLSPPQVRPQSLSARRHRQASGSCPAPPTAAATIRVRLARSSRCWGCSSSCAYYEATAGPLVLWVEAGASIYEFKDADQAGRFPCLSCTWLTPVAPHGPRLRLRQWPYAIKCNGYSSRLVGSGKRWGCISDAGPHLNWQRHSSQVVAAPNRKARQHGQLTTALFADPSNQGLAYN